MRHWDPDAGMHVMKFRTLAGFLLVLGLLISPAMGDLAGDIRAVLNEGYFKKAEVGIAIVELGSSAEGTKTIFRHQSDIPLVPASNLKLLTTSAALDRLGGEFKFHTAL